MVKKKILITVKTYPSLSREYDELVCTAGIDEDGKWIRIYPVPFRKLIYEKQYKKYDWLEIDLIRNTKDFRPETFRPNNYLDIESTFKRIGHIDSKGNGWQERKNHILKNGFYTNIKTLIRDCYDTIKTTSLAIFKPTKITNFLIENAERTWDKKKVETIIGKRAQLNLFKPQDEGNIFEITKKLPYNFSYSFEDEQGNTSTLKIEDWEIGQLYWNCLEKHNSEEKALEDVKKRYWNDFVLSNKNDIYFYMGTMLLHHRRKFNNPFIIIGLFYPPKDNQLKLGI